MPIVLLHHGINRFKILGPHGLEELCLGWQIQYQLVDAGHGNKIVEVFIVQIGPDDIPDTRNGAIGQRDKYFLREVGTFEQLPDIRHDHAAPKQRFPDPTRLKIA
ncbi:hypothetical protein DESC_190134 [Desulfosarcina cetonica]|nr:hypothetical protein DESC_190134 [Desulfosarcina cetonica]